MAVDHAEQRDEDSHTDCDPEWPKNGTAVTLPDVVPSEHCPQRPRTQPCQEIAVDIGKEAPAATNRWVESCCVAHRSGLTAVSTPSLVENLPSGLVNVEFGSKLKTISHPSFSNSSTSML